MPASESLGGGFGLAGFKFFCPRHEMRSTPSDALRSVFGSL